MVATSLRSTHHTIAKLDVALLLNNSPNPVVIIDRHGKLLWANEATKRLFHPRLKAHTTINVFDYVVPREITLAKTELSKTGVTTIKRMTTLNLKHADGTLHSYYCHGLLLAKKRGAPLYLIVAVPSPDSAEPLCGRHIFTGSVFEDAGIGITIFSAGDQIWRANRAIQRFLGYSEAEIQQLGIKGITFPEDYLKGAGMYADLIHGKRDSYQIDKRYVRKDRTIVWGRLHASLVRDEVGGVICGIGIVEDINHEKNLEERKGHFLSQAAHELKTPLTSSKLALQTLVSWHKSTGKIPPKIERMGSLLTSQFSRLERIIADILDAGRIETGKLSIKKQLFELSTLLQDIINELSLVYPGKTIRLLRKNQITVFGDQERVDQVLVNLMTNAIKHGIGGSEIEINTYRRKQWVVVEVIDHGPGIAHEAKAHMFEKYYQLPAAQGGFGLGLYISKQLVELHGGSLWVEDTPGGGATFCFSLPAQ